MRSWPSGVFMLQVTPSLFMLRTMKPYASCSMSPPAKRPSSPRTGRSTLMTSAPSQASVSVQTVPDSNWVRSTTLMPVSGPCPIDSSNA